jgi:hypothetical protein
MRGISGRSSGRTRLQALAVVGCAATVLAGSACRPRPPKPPTTTTTAPPTTVTLDNVSYTAEAAKAKASGVLPWFCKAEGLGGAMDHGHPGGLANDYYAGKTKGDLSSADCTALADMFDKIIQQVKPFKTRGDAAKDGSRRQLVQFYKGLGTHDSVSTTGFSTRPGLPPGPPMFLQYDGEADSAPLAGLSWFTFTSGPPPAGFPGDNDWWHSHTSLCYTKAGNVEGNEISDAECQAKGGFNLKLPGVWMAHAWIIPGYEDRYDVFSGAYMCVQGTGKPPAANDPCHDDHSDPEHGGGGTATTMPGMDHGGATTTRPPTGATTTRPSAGATTTRLAATTTTTMPGMDHGDHAH